MKEDILRNEKTAYDDIYKNKYELYERMVDLNPSAIFLSSEGKFIYANKKALELLKIDSIVKLQSLNTIDIVHPRYRNEVAGRRALNISEEFLLDAIEVQLLCMDESAIDVEMESMGFVSGDKLLTLTTIKEIGKWKEIRRTYQERNVLVNAIFDSTIDGVMVVDDKGEIININNRFVEMWDISEEDFHELDEVNIFKRILGSLEEPELLRSIIGKADSFINEYFDNVKFTDGRVFNFYSCPLIVEGEITGRIWSVRDITKQAEAEEKLNMSNNELIETIGKLKETQAQLIQKEKLAGIGQLAAGVAHEINNPLAYAISNIDILRKRIDTSITIMKKYRELGEKAVSLSHQDTKAQIDLIKELERKSDFCYIIEDMDELINDSIEGLRKAGQIVASLRDFSGKYGGDTCEEYNINEGIENTLTIMESEIKYYAILEKDLASLPSIKANKSQVNQVLLNMLKNSVYAIRMKGKNSLGAIKVKTYVQDKHIVCEIEDNGIGIEKENLPQIFLPFYTTKDVGEGCGLGLSTAYDIITNKYNGEIIVASVPGQGTKFTIKLPV